ncbi:MAG: mucin7-like protein [Patescibacteria group bacterium]|nr:mucin7-like protein [Patescibacteria group bacterium]
MQKQRQFLSLIVSVMMVGQLGLAGIAAADESPSPTPSATPSESPAPSNSPAPSASPEPSAAPSPEPSASSRPHHRDDSASSPSPSASPSPTPEVSYSKPGVDGCVGVIPKWVFDVAANVWVKADQGSFSCDSATHYYLSPKYVFDKRNNWYEIVPASVLATSTPDYFVTAPNVVHTVLGDLVVGSKDYEMARAMGLLSSDGGILLLPGGGVAGPAPANQVGVSNNNQGYIDLTNLVNVINTLQSVATSGNVGAVSNTQVGGATSGTAAVLANVINLLASAWSWSNGNLNFFMRDFGNWVGDLNLDPSQSAAGGGGQLGTSTTNSSELNVNAKSGANIVNNIDLTAKSGDASATTNTSAGNVTSGDARAVANIINMINSFIYSGNSFFGILNIFGNFNGDVLFPKGFLDSATASGAGPDSTSQASVNNTNQANIATSNTYGVDNNIQTNAVSGAATAGSNTSVGDVQSGAATTKQNTFNLANSSVFGDNAVLVIVNVLGHWVGKIMTLPGVGASQSALLTGNAQVGSNVTGPGSNNQANSSTTNTTNINQQSVGTITNNINVNAQSGDASATENTSVGNVKSGSAQAGSSVANIFNSVLNVKHWFGVLVINVFGDWVGDVNNDTVAGGVPGQGSGEGATAQTAATAVPRVGLLALFGGATSSGGGVASGGTVAGAQTSVSGAEGGAKVLTAAAEQQPAQKVAAIAKSKDMSILFALSAGVMLVAGALASIERKLKLKR